MDVVKREKAIALADEVGAIFRRYPDAASMPAAISRELEGKMVELDTLTEGRHLDSLRGEHSKINSFLNDPVDRPPQPGDGGGGGGNGTNWCQNAYYYGGKSIGEQFVESKAFRAYDPGLRSGPSAEINLKTLLDTGGWVPESPRIGRIEPGVGRPLNVADLFATGTTTYNSVPFLRETTTTPAAVETGEGAVKPESALAFTEVDSPVRTIACLLPITRQLMDDVGACRDYVNSRLGYFVKARLDSQLLNGDGAAPNLRGLVNVVDVQTQVKGADPTPDAIGKAMDLIRVNGGYEPDGIVMHPNDWQDVRHLRTADGLYIWGSPADANPARIWGLPVAISSACPQNTAIVGAFRTAAMLYYRTGLEIAVSDSHSDYFERNQLAVRAEIRAALPVFQPRGFCLVTGV